jgi:hypothetical protein
MPSLLQLASQIPTPRLSSVPSDSIQANRERLAVVVKQGLDAYETYQAAKPFLLWGGLLGAAISGFALAKRRHTPEAYPLYIGTFVASLAAVWAGFPSSTAPTPPGQPKVAGTGLVAALDAKRAAYAAADPRWADRTFSRLAAMPDVAAQLDKAPMVKALFT